MRLVPHICEGWNARAKEIVAEHLVSHLSIQETVKKTQIPFLIFACFSGEGGDYVSTPANLVIFVLDKTQLDYY